MSIRHSLLALLGERERYGYELRSAFEARTGATWPLNVGQVYSTLTRLERDGLVTPSDTPSDGDSPGAVGTDTQVYYRITDAGREEVARWFSTPVERSTPPRDELAIKLAMAVTVPGADVQRVIQGQRTATMQALQEYTRLKRRSGEHELAWLLVVDSLIFSAEAEVRWLDHCEARLARTARAHQDHSAPAPAPLVGAGREGAAEVAPDPAASADSTAGARR